MTQIIEEFEGKLQSALHAHRLGQLETASTLYQDLLKLEPSNTDVLHLLGVLTQQTGQLKPAEEFIRKAIGRNPNIGAYYNSLGNNLTVQGALDAAVEAYKVAIHLQPDTEEFLLNLGETYLQLGQGENTLKLYAHHCQQFTHLTETRFQLASLYFQAGMPLDSIQTYQTLIEQLPGNAAIHNNLAIVLQQTGQFQEALQHFNQALSLNPNYSEALYNRSVLQLDLQEFESAIQGYQTLLQENPDFTQAHQGLGMSYYRLGDVNNAASHFKMASRQAPQKVLQWLAAETLCPILPTSRDEIQAYRQQTRTIINQAVESLSNRQLSQKLDWNWQDLSDTLCRPSFYLPYQGENDLDLRAPFGAFYQGLFSQRYPQWMTPPAGSGQELPTLGILVTSFHEGVFCKYMGGLLEGLCQQGFKLTLICTQSSADIIRQSLSRFNAIQRQVEYLIIPNSLPHAIPAIRAQQLDILFYFESGSDALNYFLPFFNLARIQCTSLGSPVTSGIPAMQYFLSTALIEPEDYQNHYSETCIPFSNIPTAFVPPSFESGMAGREALGLQSNRHYYACPQSLFKIHPEMDALFAGILERDPLAEILLVESYYAPWQAALKRRFEQNIPNHHQRIRFLPRLSYPAYLNLILHADVLLDPLHFNGGVTSLEALAAGTPIITLPQGYARGHMTSGFYQALGVSECTTASSNQYIAQAIAVASNRDYRETLKERIIAGKAHLYDNTQSIQEMAAFFIAAHQGNLKTGGTRW